MAMFGSALDQDNSALNKAMESLNNSSVFPSENSEKDNSRDMPTASSAAASFQPIVNRGENEGEMPEGNSPAVSPMPQVEQGVTSAPHHFFSNGGIGQRIAGVIGDALLLANGRYPLYLPTVMEHNRRIEQQSAQQQQRDFSNNLASSKLSQQQANLAAKAAQPQYHFGTDGRVLSLNPLTGETTQLRDPDAPTPSEHERMISRIVNLPSNDPERRMTEQMLFRKK
ncbi:hypothetical protein FBY58_0437 [Zymomonas mobilis]|uniref:Uncharacterized protein n=1 Tax=Zymomonas mobilis TaxID=542 RepID=A0A542W000_ZYMMB|nr:hypothetical protein [Zymomonas mobilis]TQL16887.1 hypothetical protein FBY58_0437 [Zymomonas mobilis]